MQGVENGCGDERKGWRESKNKEVKTLEEW